MDKERVVMPPLRPYEFPDTPATRLDLPPDKDEFVIPGEQDSRDEILSLPTRLDLPPLRPDEVPDSSMRVFLADPGPRPDEPEWGTAKKMPEISLGRGKLLHPWDD